jgi:hypothetical protein
VQNGAMQAAADTGVTLKYSNDPRLHQAVTWSRTRSTLDHYK